MSRIGKNPISIPDKVSVDFEGLSIVVKGPKGELKRNLPEGVSLDKKENKIFVIPDNEKRTSRQKHGLSRTLISNMVIGVSQGYSKNLEIIGVGSRAQVKGKNLVVSAGFSHPVEIIPPDGITYKVENNTKVVVSGIDKEIVGNEAAKIRAIRPPEPYKGKGIKYEDERIIRKAGKSGKK
tara:strand:+ start:14982 stop:15521 length:540 start_codon:yes stop_codon:yes gene_type:complete